MEEVIVSEHSKALLFMEECLAEDFSHLQNPDGSFVDEFTDRLFEVWKIGWNARNRIHNKMLAEASHHRDLLAEKLSEIILASGFLKTDELTGPQLLQFGDALVSTMLEEKDRLTELAACMYQVAGACNAPVRVLDVLNNIANGEDYTLENILPVTRKTETQFFVRALNTETNIHWTAVVTNDKPVDYTVLQHEIAVEISEKEHWRLEDVFIESIVLLEKKDIIE